MVIKNSLTEKTFKKILVVEIVGQGMGEHLKDHDIVDFIICSQGVDEMLRFAAA